VAGPGVKLAMLDKTLFSDDDLFSICGLMNPSIFKSSLLFESTESIRCLLSGRRTGKTTNIAIKSLYNILLGKDVLIWVSSHESQRILANLIRKYAELIDSLSLEEIKFCRFKAKNIKNNPHIYIIPIYNNIPQAGDFYSLKWDIEFDDSNPFE
jgi:hypothetical protein